MLSHQVVKNRKGKGAGDIAEYLEADIENTSNIKSNISTYYENEKYAGNIEFAPESIKKHIEDKKLTTTADKIAYFSSKQRAGYDFTLSFTKDISLLAEFDENIKNEIRDVVKQTVKTMSEDVYTREQKSNKREFVKADALFQVFEHRTSRELDPQTHYHIFISNQVVNRGTGKLSSLSAERLVENKFFYDILAQYQLAERLQSRGYNAYLDSKAQLRTSFDNNIIELFSKRKQQLEQRAKELFGTSDLNSLSREQLKALVLSTRKEKEKGLDTETLLDSWINELKTIGYTKESFKNSLKREYNQELQEDDLKLAYDKALYQNEQKRGLFRYEDIAKDYLINLSNLSQEKNAKLPNLQKALEYLNNKMKTLYRVETLSNTNMKQYMYTTSDYYRVERDAFNTAIEMSNIPHQLSDTNTIQSAINNYELRNGFSLTDEQKKAVYNILYGSQLSVINGHAGAGKTTAAEIVSDVAEKQGLKIVALAPTGKAADELGKSLKTNEARTIDSFLLQDEYKVDSNTIIFVDEAGMVDTHKLSALIEIAHKSIAKLVLQGDWKQLKPVEAGDLYTDIYNHLKKQNSLALTELKTIRRQKAEEYRTITTAYSERDFSTAFDVMLSDKDKYFSNYDKNSIIRDFLSDSDNTLIVASTNSVKDELNKEIRHHLHKDKQQHKLKTTQIVNDIKTLDDVAVGDKIKLGKETYTISSVNYYNNTVMLQPEPSPKGRGRKKQKLNLTLSQLQGMTIYREKEIDIAEKERIVALKNDKELGIKNGEIFYVEKIDGSRIKLVNDNKSIWIDTKKYNYFDYAYAITVHKSQGMTVNNVLVADANNNMSYNQFYVALTRGKENLKIYTNDIVATLFKSQFADEKKTSINAKKSKSKVSILTRSDIAEKLINSYDKQKQRDIAKEYMKYIDDLQKRREIYKTMEQQTQQKEQQKQREKQQEQKQQEQKQQEQEQKRKGRGLSL